DGHRLLGAGALVLSGYVHDTVGVDVEGDLDLWDAARSRCDTGQLEGTQSLVVTGELALALEDLDGNRRLVVFSGGEGFRTLGRDRGVALDQLGHHAALGFNTQGQWGDVDEQNVLALALQYTCLQCCANSYNLIRVHALVSFLAGQ